MPTQELQQRQILSQQQLQALNILSLDGAALDEMLKKEEIDNPLFDLDKIHGTVERPISVQTPDKEGDLSERAAPDKTAQDLYLFLESQLPANATKAERGVFRHMVEFLEPGTGLLPETVEEVAEILAAPLYVVERCLSWLHQMEPAGVGAATTSESLVLQAFHKGMTDPTLLGIAAIENTIAGSLLPNHELLQQSRARIIGEQKLRISHVLAALPGQTPDDIAEVRSHPIALMQCGDFLKTLPGMKIVERDDTAGSAREIAEGRLAGTAAICGADAARLYGLEILRRGIETNKHNFTRFLLLADERRAAEFADPAHTDKASLLFTLPHTRGSLSKVLTVLSFYDINLTKIQSLPIIGREWEYRFYVDVTFDDPMRYRQAIDAARPLTSDFRILGEYAECPNPAI